MKAFEYDGRRKNERMDKNSQTQKGHSLTHEKYKNELPTIIEVTVLDGIYF